MNPDTLAELLTQVATGRRSVADAIERLVSTGALSNDVASNPSDSDQADSSQSLTLDLDRERRCGFPEVIYGAGKPAELITRIIRRQLEANQTPLATRVAPEVAATVQTQIESIRFNPVARTLSVGAALPAPVALNAADNPPATDAATPHVAVITAGSTDAPVAEEAIETLHWMGMPFSRFDDIGVAGPARLLAAIPNIRTASAAIVIAGMEGALPAAVGGHLSVPVIAVPTSVGYGATLGGLTPLMGMLSSCAANVAVVNIDAGFKAAYLAGLIVTPLLNANVSTTR